MTGAPRHGPPDETPDTTEDIVFRRYRPADFERVRDFLVDTYGAFAAPRNWTIERWNFAPSMARTMNGVSRADWAAGVGLWERGGELVAVVNAEGEASGEAFLQRGPDPLPDEVFAEAFAFAERHLPVEADGRRVLRFRIPVGETRLESLARERGYERADWHETVSTLPIEDRPGSDLPAGYAIVDGEELTDAARGLAHARAFEYADTAYADRTPRAYAAMRATPDYRADLDLYVLDRDGVPVSFATVWHDAENRLGILEPVGTVPAHRRRGLASAVIGAGLDRIAAEGATTANVVSEKPLYLALGFEPVLRYGVWEKTMAG
ncbi:GNAT family N-acetyltransferase [Haloarchaeobius amylolyticus]|uniref:GNAT family N-acetyltransferase n=1 Tax=Haloarchaeobius amylolyticus TaxID=1198296 RepID=UPI0022722195|nr:GNAT family N-acetyltransferase [Haloarchaeobius amylolyticus]